jgi:phosphatidylserine/phosphatidylglycerophosphate/cardiolipin synthase-like enzyme
VKEAGVGIRNDTNSHLLHDKVVIIDSPIVLTGSFNWSKNAEEGNNENLIIISETDIAGKHEEESEGAWREGI